MTYVPSAEDKYYVSQSVTLEPEPNSGTESESRDITEVKLQGTGSSAHIYVGTTTGIYRVSTSRCEEYTDCCACIGARDPYCAYDVSSQSCVAVDDGNRGGENLRQDVINGDIGQCTTAITTDATTQGSETGAFQKCP